MSAGSAGWTTVSAIVAADPKVELDCLGYKFSSAREGCNMELRSYEQRKSVDYET